MFENHEHLARVRGLPSRRVGTLFEDFEQPRAVRPRIEDVEVGEHAWLIPPVAGEDRQIWNRVGPIAERFEHGVWDRLLFGDVGPHERNVLVFEQCERPFAI